MPLHTPRALVAVATGAGDAVVGGHFSLVALIAGLAVQVWQTRSAGGGQSIATLADGVTDGAAALVGQSLGRQTISKVPWDGYLGPPTPGDGSPMARG